MLNKEIMPEGYLEAPLAYDAVWATALGTYAPLSWPSPFKLNYLF